MNPTVYLVDDDRAMRDSLTQLLENAGLRVKAYPGGAEFLADLDVDSAGCVLLDMSMPGMNGREVQVALVERGSGLPILFLTGHGDIQSAVQAVKAGAVDFLEKPIQGEVLLSRVRRALELGAERLSDTDRIREIRQRYARLSPREQEVMAWVVSGKSNKKIARKLDLSPRTIEVHRLHVMQKMGADNLVALVEMAAVCDS